MRSYMAVHTIENEKLKIQVSDHGGELISIIKKETGQEYIWNADAAYWGRHAPVLFPIVGGLKNKTYRVDLSGIDHKLSRTRDFVSVANG